MPEIENGKIEADDYTGAALSTFNEKYLRQLPSNLKAAVAYSLRTGYTHGLMTDYVKKCVAQGKPFNPEVYRLYKEDFERAVNGAQYHMGCLDGVLDEETGPILIAALAFHGEAGEITEKVIKFLNTYYNKELGGGLTPEERAHWLKVYAFELMLEGGDSTWYIQVLLRGIKARLQAIGVIPTLTNLFYQNRQKLLGRYKKGVFSVEESEKRAG